MPRLAAAEQVARGGTIVTLGIKPTYPSTGFGYIQLGAAQEIVDGFRVYRSGGFTEKPDSRTAVGFLESGRYAWNSGMFIWRADRLLAEFQAQLPDAHAALLQIGAALATPDAGRVLAEAWPQIRKVSIDFGIMEHASDVSVIPVDIGWSDIGSWGALLDVLPGDAQGNVCVDGDLLALDTRGAYVRSEGRLVATIGLEDIIVVDTPDVLLVCPRSRAEEVKDLVGRLAAEGKVAYL